MVGKTLFVFCIFTAGLRVESLPASTPFSVSLPPKISSPTSLWTSSPHNTTAVTTSPTSGSHNNSLLPVTSSVQTSSLFKITESRQKEVTEPASIFDGTSTNPSSPDFSPTSSGIHLTLTPAEHSLNASEISLSPTGAKSTSEAPTFTSPQAPATSPSSSSTQPPEIPSVSVTPEHTSALTSSKLPGTSTSPEAPTEQHSSSHTPTSHGTTERVTKETTSQATVPAKVTCELIDTETTTTSPGVIMEQVEHALSSGSIAAITVTVIAVVLLVFGVAAYLKIRHSSYGRLLDDHDYGSWGNYNNPLYDDS